MKILITGSMQTGKSLYANYLLNNLYRNHIILEFDDFSNSSNFVKQIIEHDNCIVVVQHKKLLSQEIHFDFIFNCVRVNEHRHLFFVESKDCVQAFNFEQFREYF